MLYRFGPYELDEERLTLCRVVGDDDRAGETIELEPKPLAVLLHLLRRHPVLVENEELLGAVWDDVVVTRSSLARAVRSLRRAFGEDADGESVIRTARGRGYGIAVPVERESGPALPSAAGAHRRGAAPPALIGREAPLAALAELLVRAAGGRGRVATLVGEAGIGKTRLGEALVESAALAGWIPLVGHCTDERHAPPLWPWVQVLRGAAAGFPRAALVRALGGDASELLALAPELPGRALPHVDVSHAFEQGAQQFRLLEAVDRFLAALARDRPVLVWIDDLHGADASSLALFAHLARNASSRALALVASHRPVVQDGGTELAELLRRLAALPHAHPPIHLDGLAVDALAAVAEMEGGFSLAPDQRELLHRQTGGNPYFAIELVRARSIQPRAQDTVTRDAQSVPERIRAVVRERVERLPESAQALLRLAAVAGRDTSLPLLARALDASEAELADQLASLERGELLREDPSRPGSFAFVHALVPEALVEEMAPSARARLHARVAQVLEELHAHDLEPHLVSLAHHYGEAGAVGETAKAVAYAQRAGDQARARLAFAEAATLYQQAIDLETASRERSDERLARLWTSLARAEAGRGQPGAAEHASLQALAHAESAGSGRLVAEAVWALAAAPYRGPGAARVTSALEAALARADDPATEALLAAALARSLLFTGAFERVDALSARAVARARETRDAVLELRALGIRELILVDDPRYAERAAITRDRVGLALELGLHAEETWARIHRVMQLIQEIEPEAIEREIEACRRLAEGLHGQPRLQAWLVDIDALRAIWRGRVAEAESLLPRIRSLWEQVDPLYGMMSIGAKQQLVDGLAGRFVSPDSAELARARDLQHFALPKPYHCSLALRLLRAGHEAEARDAFAFLSRLEYDDLNRDGTFLITAVMLAELAHRLGDAPRAARLAALLEPYRGRYASGYTVAVRGAVDRYRALLAWTRGDLAGADALLEAAVAAERRMGARPWEAIALADRARLCMRRGGADAASAARADLELADACCDGLDVPGVRAIVAAARAELFPAA